MDLHLLLMLVLLMVLAPTLAMALESRIEVQQGVTRLLVNGEPMPPMILMHTAGDSAAPLVCHVTPKWQQFVVTFRAPCDDEHVGLHINNIAPEGDWYVDDVQFHEGTPDAPLSPNLLPGGDFEGPELPKERQYFLNPSTGAAAEYSLDTADPHSGKGCLRVHITHRGTIDYEIHTYQEVRIEKGKTYTYSAWLRASDERDISLKAVHQGPPWNLYGGEAGASDRILKLGAERGLHIGTPPIMLPWPRGDEPPDNSAADAQIEHILSVDPEALIIPRIHLDAPDWWKQEHPGHRQVYDMGEYPMASPASKEWRRDASQALRLFIRHLEARFGDHMLAYHVTAQSAGEWFYDHTWEKIMPCFEEPFRQAFAEWAQARYGTVEALRAAWQQPQVTFETIRVPTLEERIAGRLGVFRDPVAQRFEIDFAEYMQVCLSEYLMECARLVKEETRGRKLTVFFYGYLYDVAGFAYGAAVSGHLRLRRVLECPDVDIVCSPISYFNRESGGTGPFMSPVDSVQAHGKMWINEDDTRTHLAPVDANFGRTDDMRQTLGVYRRNFGHQLERRCGTWWMDFGTGWMADPTIFDNFARERDLWNTEPRVSAPSSGQDPRQSSQQFSPQVAIITDEDSFLYLRNGNEISGPSVSYLRQQFNTIGCPVGLYLMEDFCDGLVPDSARLCVFLNAYRVTTRQREHLREQLSRGHRTALWLYAPGYINETASVVNIGDLTGIQVREAQDVSTSSIRLLAERGGLLPGLGAEHVFGTGTRPEPLFAVLPGQDSVTAMGTYDGSSEVGLGLKRSANWDSVFCGGLQVSTPVLRELARQAGAHIYCETGDVISACPGFLSIHATADGEKTLTFPQAVRLTDLITGEVLEPAGERHTFTMQKGDTRLFGVE